MKTNGCTMTYGRFGEGTCANHQAMTREECEKHERKGPTLARRAVNVAVGARGVWQRGAQWRGARLDATLADFDAFAHRKVAPMGEHGLVIRRKAG